MLSRWLKWATVLITLVVGGCSVLGLSGDRFWFFDLLSHFRVQYAAILLAVLVFGRGSMCSTPDWGPRVSIV